MGVLYNGHKVPVLYFDDTSSGYIYADPIRTQKICYFTGGSVYPSEGDRSVALAHYSASTASCGSQECSLSNGSVHIYDALHISTEIGYYDGELSGACPAAAVAFLLPEAERASVRVSEPQQNTAVPPPNVTQPGSNDSPGCLYTVGAMIGTVLAFLFGKLFVFALANISFFVPALTLPAGIEILPIALVAVGVYIYLRIRYKKKKLPRIIWGIVFGIAPLLSIAIVGPHLIVFTGFVWEYPLFTVLIFAAAEFVLNYLRKKKQTDGSSSQS